MSTKTVLDTHTFLWSLAGSRRLGGSARSILQDPSSKLVLPAIALAEACWIVERGRVAVSMADLIAAVHTDPNLEVVPLDRTIVMKSAMLSEIGEMHDRQIVATALVIAERGEPVQILSRDADIARSGLVEVVW